MNPGPAYPHVNPFGSDAFARLWDGWQGRQLHCLEAGGSRLHFVSRRRGLWRTLDALPYGIPVLLNDADPGSRACIERFFRLRSIRSTLSLLTRPKGTYPKVHWLEQMRSVVHLSENWEDRVDPDIKRRTARAQRDGWQVGELEAAQWLDVDLAIHDTDRRHLADARFDAAFFQKLQSLAAGTKDVYFPAATRRGRLGALHVVATASDHEVSWCLFATDEARAEGVVPMLGYVWMQQCAVRGVRWVDLGASPSSSVQRFKASYGANLVPYYSGTRRWSVLGV